MARCDARYWVFGLLVAAGWLAGCDVIQGYHRTRDDGPSTSQFRYEVEFVPNAVLVREDTSPHWQLGRYAFKRGADRLLVISRITSFAEKLTKRQINRGQVSSRYDKNLERVWITIPLGIPIGEELDLKELEWDFLIGYDEGDLDTGLMYTQPNRVLGKLKLLEERPDEVVIAIDMVVEPQKKPRWDGFHKVITVPVTPNGVRATPVRDDLAGQWLIENPPPRSTPTPTIGHTPPQAVTPEPEPVLGQAPPPPATQPATATASQDQEPEEPALTAEELVGRWISKRGRGDGHDPVFEYRLQFNANGTFVLADQRPGYPFMARWGEYQVLKDYVVFTTTRFTGLDTDNDHMHHIADSLMQSAKVERKDGGNLILTGKLPVRGKAGNNVVKSVFEKGDYKPIPWRNPIRRRK